MAFPIKVQPRKKGNRNPAQQAIDRERNGGGQDIKLKIKKIHKTTVHKTKTRKFKIHKPKTYKTKVAKFTRSSTYQ